MGKQSLGGSHGFCFVLSCFEMCVLYTAVERAQNIFFKNFFFFFLLILYLNASLACISNYKS